MVAGKRRGGTPRTTAQRKARHKSLYGGKPPPRGTGIFCRRLKAVIKDEKGAKAEYDKLLTYAPLDSVSVIKGIQRDETGHHKKLVKLRNRYCR